MDDALGARIAYWRERRGMTQRLLADRVGRSKSWIEKVEAGTRSADRLPDPVQHLPGTPSGPARPHRT